MSEVIADSDRLIIRTWREADRADYLATCNTDAVTTYLGGPASVGDIDAAIDRIAKSQRENGFSFWAVERKADGAFLGYCGLKIANLPGTRLDGAVEIGWRLREDAWGRGYAGEAAGTVIDWVWANLDVDQVVSFTIPANAPSRRLMERIGMGRRPDFDFGHPHFADGHPLRAHVAYVAERPSG